MEKKKEIQKKGGGGSRFKEGGEGKFKEGGERRNKVEKGNEKGKKKKIKQDQQFLFLDFQKKQQMKKYKNVLRHVERLLTLSTKHQKKAMDL